MLMTTDELISGFSIELQQRYVPIEGQSDSASD